MDNRSKISKRQSSGPMSRILGGANRGNSRGDTKSKKSDN